MKYRRTTILPTASKVAAGTETISIKVSDPISRIGIRWGITATATDMSAAPAADITKIELVDGSDVLHSLSGYENQALAIYSRRVGTMQYGRLHQSLVTQSFFGIDFGRKLYDPLLALDPTRFENLQLKITYALTNVYSDGAAGELEVWADVFDEKVITPIGFLMAKEHYSYTMAADGSYEYITLPTDYLLRKMLIRAHRDQYTPTAQLQAVRLDENNEKKIPFDITLEDWIVGMLGRRQVVEELIEGNAVHEEHTYYVTPTDEWCVTLLHLRDQAYNIIQTDWVNGGQVKMYFNGGSAAFQGMARGHYPHHTFEFPFGDDQDPEDWYDVTELGNLRLRLEAGDSGVEGTCQVVLEQLRGY